MTHLRTGSMSNESRCLSIKYELFSHLLAFLNLPGGFTAVFLYRSYTYQGLEREVRGGRISMYTTKYAQDSAWRSTSHLFDCFQRLQRGQDNIPLEISVKLAKHKKSLAIELHSIMTLAVLLHHLAAGETKARGQRCSILKPASRVTFLEGNRAGEILLVGLLRMFGAQQAR